MMLSRTCAVRLSLIVPATAAAFTGAIQQKRTFSRQLIGQRHPKPWNYLKKRYTVWGTFADSAMHRLTENSLILSVEGNFGAGKTAFAKELATKMDFAYVSEPDIERHLYQTPAGESFRNVVNEITAGNKFYHVNSLEEWHRDPTFAATIQIQLAYYRVRYNQTRQALLHLFSTGQGVVLDRCAFSDIVIGQALYDNNFLSDEAWRFYKGDWIYYTILELWKPHGIIYLDRSPDDCLRAIKQKGQPFEKESKVYSKELLEDVDNIYKKSFLPQIGKDSVVLSYDATSTVNTEMVIDDIERADWENETLFSNWYVNYESQANSYRKMLSNEVHHEDIFNLRAGFARVPELLHWGAEQYELNEALKTSRLHKDSRLGLFSRVTEPGAKNWF